MKLEISASIHSGFKFFFAPLWHNRARYSGTNIGDSMTTEEGDRGCRGYIILVQSRAPSSSPEDWSSSSKGTSETLGVTNVGCSREASMMVRCNVFDFLT
jgi:hypothetical protein